MRRLMPNILRTRKNISKENIGKKVFVGMSGGVDSSVSAALLKLQGYDVTGVFIKVWQPDFMPCSWKDERRDAMRAAAHLDIPFITLDLEKEYKKEVVDYMITEYRKGLTPNPDVMCNKYVKFGSFFDWAMGQGADLIATGHYAQTDGRNLFKGQDDNKDQSYFLWTLGARQLAKTLFPVGDIPKSEVRRLARKLNLPNAEKKDSQGLCFVGKVDMKEFLKHYIAENPGDVLDENGEVIGHHQGSLFYTIGERHGFTITQKTPDDAPYFVVSKDAEKNVLVVSHKKVDQSLMHDAKLMTFRIKDTNWIAIPSKNIAYQGRIRYRGMLHDMKIRILGNNEAQITFLGQAEIPASGQSLVVYDGGKCLGGGRLDII